MAAGLLLLPACTATTAVRACPPIPDCPSVPPPQAPDVRAAAQKFVDAAQAGRFEDAYELLAGSWRARYTPARLAEDYAVAKSAAKDTLARARIALAHTPRLLEAGTRAEFPIGEGKALRLLLERDGWKVESLE